MCDRLPVEPAGLPTTTWLAQSSDLDDPVEDLNVSTLQGWMPCTRHTRVTVPFTTSTCDTRSCDPSASHVIFTKPDGGARTLVKAFAA
jgi:hypothetical protein